MEITEAIIPAPRFLNAKALARQLTEAGIPEAALGLLAPDFRLPDQLLLDGRIVASIVIRRKEDPLPLRRPRQNVANAPRQTPRPSYPELGLLEFRARREPSLRRHRHFWHSLEEAKAGRRLARRQRQLLELAWKKLERLRQRQAVNFNVHGRRLTRSRQAFARWTEILMSENSPSTLTPGANKPQRRSNDAVLADMAPQRHDPEHRLRPHFTDTDSGDEG